LLELGPGIAGFISGERGIEVGQSSRVAKIHHGWSDLLQAVSLADHPGEKRHTAACAVGTLIGILGLVDEVGHAIGDPLRGGGEVGERVISNHRGTPARHSFPGALAAEVSVHRALAQFCLKQGRDSIRVPIGNVHLDGVAGSVVAAIVVGAAGPVGGTAEGKEDYADGASGGAEQTVIGLDHTIGILEQVLGVLLGLFAERGVDVYGNPAARTGSNQV